MDPTNAGSDKPSNDSALAHVAPHRCACAVVEQATIEKIRQGIQELMDVGAWLRQYEDVGAAETASRQR